MKTALSAPDIQAAVEARLGVVSDFEALPEGLVSQVYGFRQGPARFVARVSPSAFGFRKDAFAWRAFNSDTLPIPEIVAIDSLGGAAVCISRRAEGVRVQDLGPNLPVVAPAIVDILAALARTDTGAVAGFGVFDEAGKAASRSWREHLMRVADARVYDWAAAGDRLDLAQVDKAIRAMERLAPADAPSLGLVHGDFGSANLISDGQRVTAVIDWDRALVGDPAYDEANLLFWGEKSLRAVHALLLSAHAGDAEWARRTLCYRLRIGLEELYDSAVERAPVPLDWLIARCADLIAEADRTPG